MSFETGKQIWIGNKSGRYFTLIALSVAISFIVFWCLTLLTGIHYTLASTIGYAAGLLGVSYLLKPWIGNISVGVKRFEPILCLCCYGLLLLLSIGALRVFVEALGTPIYLANILAFSSSTVGGYLLIDRYLIQKNFGSQIAKIFVQYRLNRQIFMTVLLGTLIKLSLMPFFYSLNLIQRFIPFLRYYFDSGFRNPYVHFFGIDKGVFPYSAIMLWFFSFPALVAKACGCPAILASLHGALFLAKIPLLCADTMIFVMLCSMLPLKVKQIVQLYWLNPIVLYICYIHGQLDVIPTAFFVIAVVFLLKRHHLWAFFFYGISLACKLHLLAAFPFLLMFVYFRESSIRKLVVYSLVALVTVVVPQIPFLSKEFIELVYFDPTCLRILDIGLKFGTSGPVLLFAPSAIGIIAMYYWFKKSMSSDLLMLILGTLYGSMVLFAQPPPGWYFLVISLYNLFLR